MTKADRQSIRSIEDVFVFVDKLSIPFGERFNYLQMMFIDLVLVTLSFVASFLYLSHIVLGITNATIDVDTKRPLFLLLIIARFLTYF